VEVAPEAAFRYRSMLLRRMTAEELVAAVDPGRVVDDRLAAEDV